LIYGTDDTVEYERGVIERGLLRRTPL